MDQRTKLNPKGIITFSSSQALHALCWQHTKQAQAARRCTLAGVDKSTKKKPAILQKETQIKQLAISSSVQVVGIMHTVTGFLLLVLNAYRIVPLNKIGSWRMIDSLDLNVCKGSLAISMPSMIILPMQKKNDRLLVMPHSHWQRHGSLSIAVHCSRNKPGVAYPFIQ